MLPVFAVRDAAGSGGLRLTAVLMEMIGYCIIVLLGKLYEQMNGFFYARDHLLKKKCIMKGMLFPRTLLLAAVFLCMAPEVGCRTFSRRRKGYEKHFH